MVTMRSSSSLRNAEMDYRQIPALFLADAAGLDFLNSVATPVDEEVDWIADGAGLLAWLGQAGMVPPEVLDDMRASVASDEFDVLAAQARELREWFRRFVRERKGRPLATADLAELEPLNRLLAKDERYGALVAGSDRAFEFIERRRWKSPGSLLMPIAEALARLVCDEDFTHVKACEGPRCTLLFADHTRGHARRWCSMAVCGNRAKVAAHRKRLKDLEAG
jgi:predicted RNA-binding Zn ribbon-like protein